LTEETEYVCPECGVNLPANAAKCPGCGLEFASDGNEGVSAPEEEAGGEESVEATPTELSEAAAEGEAEEGAPAEEPFAPAPTKAPRKGFLGGLLGPVGLTFLVLAVLAVVGTVVLLNWDVWIQGASEESVGDRQRLYVYLGVVGIVVCALVALVDILRRRK
jgi:hypothetical protein